MSTEKIKSVKADAATSNGKDSDSIDKPECFIIMPISDPEGYVSGHFKRVFEDLFIPACDRAGYHAIRADQVRQTNLIHLDVLQKIINSPMSICDLSSRNPNVLFELGLRQAFDKPVVLVQEAGTPQIFDINPLRYTEYRREMLYRQVMEDQENLTAAITATKEAIKDSKSINSIVKLLSLTQPATLTTVSETDKESALLQVIMTELGNLRREFKAALRSNTEGLSYVESRRSMTTHEYGQRALTSQSKILIDYIDMHGLKDYLSGLGISIRLINKGLKNSENVLDFLNFLLNTPLTQSQLTYIKELRALDPLYLSYTFHTAKNEVETNPTST